MIQVGCEEHGHRIASSAGTVFNPASDQVIARVEKGRLYGGVLYTDYTGASISMHTAGFAENWLNRDLLWMAFDYPFKQLGIRKVFVQIRETNRKSLEFATNLGFKIVTRIEDVFPDGACIILAIAREDCRWLNIRPRSVAPGSRT